MIENILIMNSTVWRYFSFSNQTLAMIVLWAESVYLLNEKKNYLVTLIPAIFMSAVTSTYFMVAKECLGAFGIHRFYLGYNGIGIAQIVVSLFTCIIGGAIWGFIEGLCILCDTAITTDSEGNDLV